MEQHIEERDTGGDVNPSPIVAAQVPEVFTLNNYDTSGICTRECLEQLHYLSKRISFYSTPTHAQVILNDNPWKN